MKKNTPVHPKMYDLAEKLRISHYAAVGIMECLWHFTADVAKPGDIGKFTNIHIARAVHWDGDPNVLVEAFITTGWIDEVEKFRLIVHDWREHCEDSVHWYLHNRRLTFWDGTIPSLTKLSEEEREKAKEDYIDKTEISRGQPQPRNGKEPVFLSLFQAFWGSWPENNKTHKAKTITAWNSIVYSEAIAHEILDGQRIHLQPGGNLTDIPQGKKIYAVTWLNQRRWREPYLPTQAARNSHYQETANPKAHPVTGHWKIFWGLWPKKQKEKAAAAAWTKKVTTEALAKEVIEAVRTHLQPGGELANPDPKFIPRADNWLSDERWNDEYSPSPEALADAAYERDPTDEDVLRGTST